MIKINAKHLIVFIIAITLLLGGKSNLANSNQNLSENTMDTGLSYSVLSKDTNLESSSTVSTTSTTFSQPLKWVENTPIISPSERMHTAMAYDSDNDKIILFGGYNSSLIGDTWIYDFGTNTWEEVFPAISPSATFGHAMVYDPVIKKVVLYKAGETWTYDYPTNTWEQKFSTVIPTLGLYAGMIYDSFNQKIIIFGGSGDGFSAPFETWELDTSTFNWTNLNAITPIPLLTAMAYSYDSDANKIIVYGGQNLTNIAYRQNNTFAYDYATNEWTQLFPSTAPPHMRFFGKPMVYDPINKKSVLFGGSNNTALSDETWVFDYNQNSWELVPTTNTPSARFVHSMVYNSKVKRFIMFGGNAGGYSNQTFSLSLDITPPQITGPNEVSLEYGDSNSLISWRINDSSDGTYEVLLDGSIISNGSFIDDELISFALPSIPAGNYSLTINATDYIGNSALITIPLHVLVNSPPTIISPGDMYVEYGKSSYSFSWQLFDISDGAYDIQMDGYTIDSGNFSDGQIISVVLVNLEIGNYSLSINATDTLGNSAINTIVLSVYKDTIPFIISPGDISIEFGTTDSVSWQIIDKNNGSYSIYLDGIVVDTGNYTDAQTISFSLSDLAVGNYSFTLNVTNSLGNSVIDTVTIFVNVNSAPVIISPGDITTELGKGSYSIVWQINDPSGGTYEIYVDDQLAESGNFSDGQSISLLLFNLNIGNHTLSITATDTFGTSTTDVIILSIIEFDPPIIKGPKDMKIKISEFNVNITWVLEDLSPATYVVFQNDTMIKQGSWNNNDSIVINLDLLIVGYYIFEIQVVDTFGNSASDIVTIRIYDPGMPKLSSPDDIFTIEGAIGKKIVWDVADNNPTNYILQKNGKVIGNDTYLNLFFIEVKLDGYPAGVYNFTLTLYDEDNQSVSDFVEVQIFPRNNNIGQNPGSNPRGSVSNFIQNIDPQYVALGAFVAVAGGAYFVFRQRRKY